MSVDKICRHTLFRYYASEENKYKNILAVLLELSKGAAKERCGELSGGLETPLRVRWTVFRPWSGSLNPLPPRALHNTLCM